MIIIKEANQFGHLQEQELADFEKINSIHLPLDYRTFLLEYNGGVPSPNVNRNPKTIVKYILGMHNGDFYASLYKFVDVYKNRIPLSTFPFASDMFGNIFIMSLHPENFGHIFFWDHEGEPEEQDGHYVENCRFVTYSFDEFLNNLSDEVL